MTTRLSSLLGSPRQSNIGASMNPAARGAIHLLRLLLDEPPPRPRVSDIDWRTLLPLALRNGVLLRTVARAGPAAPPSDVASAVVAERQRVDATVALIERVAAECDARAIPHVFISALQHLPDVGLDVDLLVPDRAPGLGAALESALGTRPLRRGFGARLSGAITYPGGADAIPLDVHRGRLGVAGEHLHYPTRLLAHPHTVALGDAAVRVPNVDDQMVLQGMHRVYGRRHIRIGDLVTTVAAIRRDALDWDRIFERSADTGTLDGLNCYLRFVETVHREVLGRPLLDPALLDRLEHHQWGPVSLHNGVVCFPVLRVHSRLFPYALARQVQARNWLSAARLCLVPALVVESTLRRLARRRGVIPIFVGAAT